MILVYDISCQPTFDCLPDWLREIEEYASNKVLRVLVGQYIFILILLNIGEESFYSTFQAIKLIEKIEKFPLMLERNMQKETTCTF